jgi:hypothetical protein
MADDTQQVIETVRKFLEPHQPKDYRLHVLEKSIRHDRDWWEVVVQPDKDNIRSYEYHTILAETENELEEQTGMNVLLVPVLPG